MRYLESKRVYQRKKRIEAKEAGVCRECLKRPRHKHLSQCLDCQFRRLAKNHLGSRDRAAELINLLEAQGYRCAYSGRLIDIGENASVEHVVPVSRDRKRKTDITNIKFVDQRINQMKQGLPLSEFLGTCKEVLRFFGYEVIRDESK
jgi:5-methylcytosine-specific restriction endonuclease McrA